MHIKKNKNTFLRRSKKSLLHVISLSTRKARLRNIHLFVSNGIIYIELGDGPIITTSLKRNFSTMRLKLDITNYFNISKKKKNSTLRNDQ